MRYCCVPKCRSGQRRKQDGVSFHEIPVESTSRERWLMAISREERVPNSTSNYSVVCSLHFLPPDFKDGYTRRLLKPGAVPSVFDDPTGETVDIERVAVMRDRRIRKRKREPSTSNAGSHDDHDIAALSTGGSEMEASCPKANESPTSENTNLGEPVRESTSLLSGNQDVGLLAMTGPAVVTNLTCTQDANNQDVLVVVSTKKSARKKVTLPYKRSVKTQTAPSAPSSHFFFVQRKRWRERNAL
ncbi:hypothetical protein HPB51_022501 [Rhipicephalus microplus]|uniref:THAP-type domain-containing protein n=1 Tax=Rhipicephalus microplus TaxID=6941 RepID=A0A9J6EBT5_RHIMP|nr:hypothetical protein HPB51_022501 [Rhipicephalus microplus]